MQSWIILLAIAVGIAFIAEKLKQPYPILGVSPAFPGRDTLLAMTFANVLFSLLVQGTTIQRMVRFLKIK